MHDVLARFDAYDLSKVIYCAEEESTKAKILSGLPRSKREEVLEEAGTLENVDPIEAAQIGQRIITRLVERMSKAA